MCDRVANAGIWKRGGHAFSFSVFSKSNLGLQIEPFWTFTEHTWMWPLPWKTESGFQFGLLSNWIIRTKKKKRQRNKPLYMIVTWWLQKLSGKPLGSVSAAVFTEHTTLNTWLNLLDCKAFIKNAGLRGSLTCGTGLRIKWESLPDLLQVTYWFSKDALWSLNSLFYCWNAACLTSHRKWGLGLSGSGFHISP